MNDNIVLSPAFLPIGDSNEEGEMFLSLLSHALLMNEECREDAVTSTLRVIVDSALDSILDDLGKVHEWNAEEVAVANAIFCEYCKQAQRCLRFILTPWFKDGEPRSGMEPAEAILFICLLYERAYEMLPTLVIKSMEVRFAVKKKNMPPRDLA